MEKYICESCKKELLTDYNFCPYCGIALTDIAKRLNKEKVDVIKLKFLSNLADQIEDKKVLSKIKQIANKIAQ